MASTCMNSPRFSLRPLLPVFVVLLVWPTPVGAQDSISDIRQKREDARDAKAAALAEIDFLKLEDAQLADILAEIQASVDAQVARVAGARQSLDSTVIEVANSRLRVEDAEAELVTTKEQISDRAVRAYIGSNNGVEPWLQSADLNRTAIRLAFLDFTAGIDRDLLDRLRRLEALREGELAAGIDAEMEADELRVELENELTQLEERRRVQDSVRFEVENRIYQWQAEATQRQSEADDMTNLILRKQAEAIGFAPGSAGAESVKGFVFPTAGRISSKFGPRRHPVFGSTRSHPGLDITGRTGDPVWATKAGRVIFAGRRGGYGNAVVIQHEGNITSLYAHMSSLQASQGDWIEKGELVGLIGSTGLSTGPHLHFEIRVNAVPKDPELFVPA